MDLFNRGYYWEAHAQWERLWKGSRSAGARSFLAGLIQAAAAHVKRRAGQEKGARRLLARALTNLSSVSPRTPRFSGLDLEALATELERREPELRLHL